MENIFEDIRPFKDSEYQTVIKRLLQHDFLLDAVIESFPQLDKSTFKQSLLSYSSIFEFQNHVSCGIIQFVIDTAISSFSFEGLKNCQSAKANLYISNHRDIVLDSALVVYCLNTIGYATAEIAVGSNLLSQPWVKDWVRLNKSFIVKRNLPKLEMLAASKTLSAYIKYTLQVKKNPIWIAQREGRAKDGKDKTNPALLKMFAMAKDGDLLDYLIDLNITPVSISYELDSCDYLKVPELIKKQKGEQYIKEEGEDERHMMLGMTGNKGRTKLFFSEPIGNKLKKYKGITNRNELFNLVAKEIDYQIIKNYQLWSTNYIAYDILNSTTKYAQKYTQQEKEQFENYMNERLIKLSNHELNKPTFLMMYANPVVSFEQLSQTR